jgi:hypothetical protein
LTAPAAAAPDTAGTANAFAAAVPTLKPTDTAVFHGLFADANRTAPLAPVVSALWGVPNAEQVIGATAARTADRQRRARSVQGQSGGGVVMLDLREELW